MPSRERQRRNSVGPAGPTYAQTFLAMSPAGYFRLGEPSGTSAADLGSGAHTGTYVNGPTLGVAGLVTDADTAVTFASASSQRVTFAAPWMTVVDNWTLLAWIKPSAPSALQGVAYNGDDTANGYGIYLNASNRLLGYANGGGAGLLTGAITGGSGAILSTGVTVLVALVREAGTSHMYVNGVLYEDGIGTTPNTPATTAIIGASGAANYLNCTCDEVGAVARVVTPAEQLALYAFHA